jgi:hypothetical protein
MTDDRMDMTETDRLAQRFVDQELSAEERLHLLARLGRDEALRAQLLSLERLAFDVARLPRPVVPAGFVEGVMRRMETGAGLEARGLPRRSGFAAKAGSTAQSRTGVGWLWAPRLLRWNFASAVGVAALVVFVLAGAVLTGLSWRQAPTGATTVASAPTLASDSPTMLVRLIVMQPDAKAVAVAGDFNGWNPTRTPLERLSGDAWAVTTPLRPGRYEYMFVVDGTRWVADPFATERHDDGFGSQNAVLDVRPTVTPL